MADTAVQSNRILQPDSDVHVTREDQGKINQFATCSAKKEDIKAELTAKRNQLQNLEDAAEELILLDDDVSLPFKCGELFIYMDLDEANNALNAAKKKINREIIDAKDTMNELKIKMSELKTDLYAKFGNRINLEEEEEDEE